DGDFPTELTPLAGNLNALIETERRRLVRYRNMLDDLAHSLKTPLAAMRRLLSEHAIGLEPAEGKGSSRRKRESRSGVESDGVDGSPCDGVDGSPCDGVDGSRHEGVDGAAPGGIAAALAREVERMDQRVSYQLRR